MIKVPLGQQGHMALIDDEDARLVSEVKWQIFVDRPGLWYAFRVFHDESGNKVRTLLHRAVLDAKPGQIVDHIDGDGLDCRRHNLRFCTSQQNSWNMKRSINQRAGKYRGVAWNKTQKKWIVRIAGVGTCGPRGSVLRKHLGCFDDPVEAAKAYDRAAVHFHGEFASLNFPHSTPGPFVELPVYCKATAKGGYRGVTWDAKKGKWQARVSFGEHRFHVGYFSSQIEAAKEHDTAARSRFGAAARLNFPSDWVGAP